MNNIYNCDWLKNDIPDKSINLIIADPPYFEVKGEFDFIWETFGDYLQDVSRWAIECKRVLADNGSLLWWGHAKKIAYSQVIFDKYFNLENSLVWENTNQHKQQIRFSPDLRSFAPLTERLLFYSNDDPLNLTKCIYNARDYIRNEIIKSKGKIILKDINIALGTAFNGGGVASAVLSLDKTEPVMITEELYEKLQKWCKPYMNKLYEELRNEYEELRRPYENIYNLGDVIHFANRDMQDYDHDTIKPLTLTKKLIQTTTRKGDLVLIPFGGSGTEVEACINTGREYICYEINEKHYKTIADREKKTLMQGELFT